MKHLLRFFLAFATLFYFLKTPGIANAQGEYEIKSFESEVTLEQDTSLEVKETIIINFPDSRHGIYRIIPVVYSYKGKTIKADFKLVSVKDENGNHYKYEKSRLGQSIELKIGDPNVVIEGVHTYVLTYKINDILQRYDTYDEIYWNITGHEWDTEIINASARVVSPYAKIEKVDCFAGLFGSTQKFCDSTFSENDADFSSTAVLGDGRDFTIVIALNKKNDLVFSRKSPKCSGFYS